MWRKIWQRCVVRKLNRRRIVTAAAVATLAAFLALAPTVSAHHILYAPGNVFAAVGRGHVNEFTPAGTLVERLDTTTGSFDEGGMCFDTAGNLYVTNSSTDTMTGIIMGILTVMGIIITSSWQLGVGSWQLRATA